MTRFAGNALAVGIVALAAPAGANEVMSWVAPYAISSSQAVANADFGQCSPKDTLTRVGLQFWTPNTDGTIKYADHEWYIPDDSDVNWWTNWCAANDVECLLTIYNNDGSWNWPLARAAFKNNRASFVSALTAEVDRLGLDGIDVDLEGIGDLDADRAAFDLFISALATEMAARGKILTIDTFPHIWNAPNVNWWSDWVGEVDNIHSMGYADLYEGGADWRKYSHQQSEGIAAGYLSNQVMMGMPGWLGSWGSSSGRGTSALAHVQEAHHDLADGSTGVAIWDMQMPAWQDSSLWCEIRALRDDGPVQNEPPSPNPLTWSSAPVIQETPGPAAVMTATTATDIDGGIEYLFDCIEAPTGGQWQGCEDSSWQSSASFSDAGLAPGVTYSYRARARDTLGAMTGWSPEETITVAGNNSGPMPDPMAWASTPYLNPTWPNDNVATMTAVTASDPDGVAYFLDCIEAPAGNWWKGCEDSGWQTGATFSDWYLEAGVTYTYRVKTRDGVGNETGWSPNAIITVDGDNAPPSPDPMTWLDEPSINLTWPEDNVATMTAVTASDPDGGIQYFFDCVEAPAGGGWMGCEDSGWQSAETFSDWYLTEGETYTYQVKARDGLGDETGWSATATLSIPGANAPPTAAFGASCVDLTCTFSNTSTDDGAIVANAWNFGDGNSSSAANPMHSYATGGSYFVSLNVTDDDGAADSATMTITVVDTVGPPAAPNGLTAEVQSTGKGKKKSIVGVLLRWVDNSSDEDSFVVERCEETGKGRRKVCDFAELSVVGANVTEFSDAPGAGTWKYRVKARNAHGDSISSNEVKI